MDADILLVPQSSGEPRKEFPCEVAGIGSVGDILAAKIVIEDSAGGCFVDVWEAKIHAVAFDGAGHATDEDYGAIRFLPFDDPDVRQRVVHLVISIVVPCVVEEDEVAGTGDRSPVECALLFYVRMDDLHTIRIGIARLTVIQIDAVFEEDGPGDAGTVVGDASTVALNRFGAHKFGRCPHDRAPARHALDGLTTGSLCRQRCARALSRLRGTAHERHDCDGGHDEEESHRPHRTLTNRPWAVSRS
jgi:hypothetical protein